MAQELNIIDRSAISPTVDDLVSDELIAYLNNCSSYNKDLGTANDPRYPSYKEFLAQIDQSVILQIDPQELSSGKFDDIDLSNTDDPKDYIVEDKRFFGTNKENDIVNILLKSYWMTFYTDGISIGKEYMPVPDDFKLWSNPVFSDK